MAVTNPWDAFSGGAQTGLGLVQSYRQNKEDNQLRQLMQQEFAQDGTQQSDQTSPVVAGATGAAQPQQYTTSGPADEKAPEAKQPQTGTLLPGSPLSAATAQPSTPTPPALPKQPMSMSQHYQNLGKMASMMGLSPSVTMQFMKASQDSYTSDLNNQINYLKLQNEWLNSASGDLMEMKSTGSMIDYLKQMPAFPGRDRAIQTLLTLPSDAAGVEQAKKYVSQLGMSAADKIKQRQEELISQRFLATLNKNETDAKDRELREVRIEASQGIKQDYSELTKKGIPSSMIKQLYDEGLVDNAPSNFDKQSVGTQSTQGFLQGRGAYESKTNYGEVNQTTGALGKYQIMPSTYDQLRKIDPTLPESTSEFLKNPKAQEKAADLLDKSNVKDIKNAGYRPTQANKDLWWFFGSSDAKKVKDAAEENPNTPIESIGLNKSIIDQNPQLKGKTVGEVIAGNVSAKPGDVASSLDREKTNAANAWENAPYTVLQKAGDSQAVGQDYGIPPRNFIGLTSKSKTELNNSHIVANKIEETADWVAKHPDAVGSLSQVVRKAGGYSLNLLDNIINDKSGKYTKEAAEAAKQLFTLATQDAGATGRMNQYLERSFSNIYDPSLSASTLLGIMRLRERDAFDNIKGIIPKASTERLDQSKYPLWFSGEGKEGDYMKSRNPSDWESKDQLPEMGSAIPKGWNVKEITSK